MNEEKMQKICLLKLLHPFQMTHLTLRLDFWKKSSCKKKRSGSTKEIRGEICVTLVAFDHLRVCYGIKTKGANVLFHSNCVSCMCFIVSIIAFFPLVAPWSRGSLRKLSVVTSDIPLIEVSHRVMAVLMSAAHNGPDLNAPINTYPNMNPDY